MIRALGFWEPRANTDVASSLIGASILVITYNICLLAIIKGLRQLRRLSQTAPARVSKEEKDYRYLRRKAHRTNPLMAVQKKNLACER